MKLLKLIPILLMLVISAPAWSQAATYSPEYYAFIRKGDNAFNSGRYNEAIRFYAAAANVHNGNPAAAKRKINMCREKLRQIAADNMRNGLEAVNPIVQNQNLDETVVWEAEEKYNGNRNLNEPVNQNRIRKERE